MIIFLTFGIWYELVCTIMLYCDVLPSDWIPFSVGCIPVDDIVLHGPVTVLEINFGSLGAFVLFT